MHAVKKSRFRPPGASPGPRTPESSLTGLRPGALSSGPRAGGRHRFSHVNLRPSSLFPPRLPRSPARTPARPRPCAPAGGQRRGDWTGEPNGRAWSRRRGLPVRQPRPPPARAPLHRCAAPTRPSPAPRRRGLRLAAASAPAPWLRPRPRARGRCCARAMASAAATTRFAVGAPPPGRAARGLPSPPLLPPQRRRSGPAPAPAPVGDCHEKWSNAADGPALAALGADHVLFVGDIGNSECVDLVAEIAALDHPKSVILGNHGAGVSLLLGKARGRGTEPSGAAAALTGSAWPTSLAAAVSASQRTPPPPPHPNPDAWTQLSARPMGQHPKRERVTAAAADQLRAQQLAGGGGGGPGGGAAGPPPRSKVHQQLDALGALHVGYGEAHLEGRGVTVVGARPFSKASALQGVWGGQGSRGLHARAAWNPASPGLSQPARAVLLGRALRLKTNKPAGPPPPGRRQLVRHRPLHADRLRRREPRGLGRAHRRRRGPRRRAGRRARAGRPQRAGGAWRRAARHMRRRLEVSGLRASRLASAGAGRLRGGWWEP
jgi:hypothetical protein